METAEETYVGGVRCKIRNEKFDHWKAKRQTLMNLHRPDVSIEEDNVKDLTLSEFLDLVLLLKKEKSRSVLHKIQKALLLGEKYIAEFLSVGGALYALTGILTGHDAELQLDAAACITNLAAGSHKPTFTLMKATAPYLITFLCGSNPLLKEQSLWALRNMAADCEICRKQLKDQGVLQAVVPLLKSPSDDILMAAVFCLRCFTRHEQIYTRELLDLNVGQELLELAKRPSLNTEISMDVWFILFHFSASVGLPEIEYYFISNNFTDVAIELLWKHCCGGDVMVVTPLLRFLGNLSTLPQTAAKIAANTKFTQCVLMLINNQYVHIRKELFWMLSNLICNEDVAESLDIATILYRLPDALRSKEDVVIQILNFLCTLISKSQKWAETVSKSAIGEMLTFLTTSPYTEVSDMASVASKMLQMQFRMS